MCVCVCVCVCVHYDNTPMHFNAIFHGPMDSFFETKLCDIFLWFKLPYPFLSVKT